jgi:hypothetical protein
VGGDPVTVKSLNSAANNTGDLYISGALTVAGNFNSVWNAGDIYLDTDTTLSLETRVPILEGGRHIFEWNGGEIIGTGPTRR